MGKTEFVKIGRYQLNAEILKNNSKKDCLNIFKKKVPQPAIEKAYDKVNKSKPRKEDDLNKK